MRLKGGKTVATKTHYQPPPRSEWAVNLLWIHKVDVVVVREGMGPKTFWFEFNLHTILIFLKNKFPSD
jgi:hypothetical protein